MTNSWAVSLSSNDIFAIEDVKDKIKILMELEKDLDIKRSVKNRTENSFLVDLPDHIPGLVINDEIQFIILNKNEMNLLFCLTTKEKMILLMEILLKAT